MTSRKEQQAELLIYFDSLIAPIEELVDYPDQQNAQTRAKASAKFTHDRSNFQHLLDAFTQGEPGHNYKVENSQISGSLNRFTNQMLSFRDNREKLQHELQTLRKAVISSILAIPSELDSEVLEAGSPCSSKEFRDFLDVSKLFANERGSSGYCLMYHSDLHDRYLKCDETVYHLGGSMKDAGRKSNYTISEISITPDAETEVLKLINESSEQFGLNSSNHP